MITHLVAQPFDAFQSGGVLLCGDDTLRSLHGCKGVVDELDVSRTEVMMVAESEWGDVVAIR